MAKDDYHVLVYRILVYLYACLKKCEKPSLEYMKNDTDAFPVGFDYWQYIFRNLYSDGYIEGVVSVPVIGDIKQVKVTDELMITPKGIEYLQENSSMKRAMNFLKELKATIPGM